tara:strand:+ start:3163 stop:3885 length:723 start_codon:yes stop_codon:yes gene_type:complete
MQQQKKKESLSYLIQYRSIKRNSVDLSKLKGYSVIFNTESIYYFFRDSSYRQYVRGCKNIFIDGAALSLIANIFSLDVERYHGPDLLEDLEDLGLLKNAVLVGGRKENKKLMEKNILKLWIDLPFLHNPKDLSQIAISEIKNKANVPIVLISLGLPKQEIVTLSLGKEFDHTKTLFIPLGAAIDFRTGAAVRSSRTWRNLGFEWLPRLIREPRMFIRNINSLIGVIFFFFHLLQKKFLDF